MKLGNYYSKTGLPDADRALMRVARLSTVDENEDEDMEITSEYEPNNGDEIIHGQSRWPPNVPSAAIARSRPAWTTPAASICSTIRTASAITSQHVGVC